MYVTGKAATQGALPDAVKNPGTLAKDDRMSTLGDAAVGTSWAPGSDAPLADQNTADEPRSVRTQLRVLDTGAKVTLQTEPGAEPLAPQQVASGGAISPALKVPSGPTRTTTGAKSGSGAQSSVAGKATTAALAAAAASPNDPVEAERMCAVPRGDVKKQALQPTPARRSGPWTRP